MNSACEDPVEFHPQNYNTAGGFRSKHPGGANFLMVDGSTHFFTDDINMDTYLVLGHRSDAYNIVESPF